MNQGLLAVRACVAAIPRGAARVPIDIQAFSQLLVRGDRRMFAILGSCLCAHAVKAVPEKTS